ncbi:hypothetical protein BDA96_01G367500 [Sorghum bicolor]|uniref:Uncharacterized protein n=1 Tax=Sorghum bicolor TaxID=4558 RepID=A0A921S2F1_SORBI|nr:hypothetical protein BDA96_01G367500 [Sorghum bicolor]
MDFPRAPCQNARYPRPKPTSPSRQRRRRPQRTVAEVQAGGEEEGFSEDLMFFVVFSSSTLASPEKLHLAARVTVATEDPQDIIVQFARPYGRRAVLKFVQYTGANAIACRHILDTFTNQLQTSFSEPCLLVVTDPKTDHHVDLFFHWDPVETNKLEEEEAPVALDYAAVADYDAPSSDNWGAE